MLLSFHSFRTTAVLAAAAIVACTPARAADGHAVPRPAADLPLSAAAARDTAFFAGGCFWGLEGVFEHVRGVIDVVSGFAGGTRKDPSYEDVGSGATGHAESVRIVYDPSKITYGTLLRIFFAVAHDPTELDRQGPDVGPQYRSAIFFRNPEQERTALAYIAQLTAEKVFSQPIVTEVAPLDRFWPAGAYHQDFMQRNPTVPYIVINDRPKVEALRKEFPELYVARW